MFEKNIEESPQLTEKRTSPKFHQNLSKNSLQRQSPCQQEDLMLSDSLENQIVSPLHINRKKPTTVFIQKHFQYQGPNRFELEIYYQPNSKISNKAEIGILQIPQVQQFDPLYRFPVITQQSIGQLYESYTNTARNNNQQIKDNQLPLEDLSQYQENESQRSVLRFSQESEQDINMDIGHCLNIQEFILPQDMFDVINQLQTNSVFRSGEQSYQECSSDQQQQSIANSESLQANAQEIAQNTRQQKQIGNQNILIQQQYIFQDSSCKQKSKSSNKENQLQPNPQFTSQPQSQTIRPFLLTSPPENIQKNQMKGQNLQNLQSIDYYTNSQEGSHSNGKLQRISSGYTNQLSCQLSKNNTNEVNTEEESSFQFSDQDLQFSQINNKSSITNQSNFETPYDWTHKILNGEFFNYECGKFSISQSQSQEGSIHFSKVQSISNQFQQLQSLSQQRQSGNLQNLLKLLVQEDSDQEQNSKTYSEETSCAVQEDLDENITLNPVKESSLAQKLSKVNIRASFKASKNLLMSNQHLLASPVQRVALKPHQKALSLLNPEQGQMKQTFTNCKNLNSFVLSPYLPPLQPPSTPLDTLSDLQSTNRSQFTNVNTNNTTIIQHDLKAQETEQSFNEKPDSSKSKISLNSNSSQQDGPYFTKEDLKIIQNDLLSPLLPKLVICKTDELGIKCQIVQSFTIKGFQASIQIQFSDKEGKSKGVIQQQNKFQDQKQQNKKEVDQSFEFSFHSLLGNQVVKQMAQSVKLVSISFGFEHCMGISTNGKVYT